MDREIKTFHRRVTRLLAAARPSETRNGVVGGVVDMEAADLRKLNQVLLEYGRLGSLVRALAADANCKQRPALSNSALAELISESTFNLRAAEGVSADRLSAIGSKMSEFPVLTVRPASLKAINSKLKRAGVGEGLMVRDPHSRHKRDEFSLAAEEFVFVFSRQGIDFRALAATPSLLERKRRWAAMKSSVSKNLQPFLEKVVATPLKPVNASKGRAARGNQPTWEEALLGLVYEPNRPAAKRRYRVTEKVLSRIEYMFGVNSRGKARDS